MFGSVEGVHQIESEPRAEEGEVKHCSPLKDITSGLPSCNTSSPSLSDPCPRSEKSPLVTESAVGPATSQQSAEESEDLKEKSNSASQPEGGDITDPVAKDEVSETREETVSESEVVKDGGNSKSQETSESEKQLLVEENMQVEHLKAAETNLRSAPEKTNVLRLEKEIHNEYYQAPPLGQTLIFQAHKSKADPIIRSLCPSTAGQQNEPTETKQESSENPETTSEKSPLQTSNASAAESERKDPGATLCDLAETKKIAEIPVEKPGSNSPVRHVLNALQSLSSHSRQSPDTADSDDSPSALEMEDIPAGITCVNSENIKARPLAGLAAPPFSFAQREKMASQDLVQDDHLDTACNTSPEGTDLGLSEEEPDMENVLTEPDSSQMGGDAKLDISSEEQTYTVSITHNIEIRFDCKSQAFTNKTYFCSKRHWTCT